LAVLTIKQTLSIFNPKNYVSVEKTYYTYAIYESTLGLLDYSQAIQFFDIDAFESEDLKRNFN
jgi:hypothetical protein